VSGLGCESIGDMLRRTDKKRVVLAGGSGFLGERLAEELLARNYEVVVLTRSPRERSDAVREAEWSGTRIGEWIRCLDGVDAVVNLAGRNINCRHTPENVLEIVESRVNSVRVLAEAFAHIAHPPRVWVQAGAIGFYGDRGDQWCHEGTPSGEDKLAEICQQWENAFNSVIVAKTRRVLLRIGLVLGRDGGALPVLARLTKWFCGGTVGSGKQYVSWIHLTDLNRMFLEAMERKDVSGTFNATAPNPVTNKEFMRELRRVLHRPSCPPTPAWGVRLGSWLMRTEPSLALSGCRCAPKRFLEAGFRFQFPDLSGALKNIYG
jgi:uncharacterized protein (TIGR01777 family)